MKKAAALILICLMLMQVASPIAFAATEANAYISAYGSSITNPSSGVIHVGFSVTGTNYMSSLGASFITLYEDGSAIKTYSRYNVSDAPYMVATNRLSFSNHVTYSSAKAGSTYYAVVTVFASDGSGTGTESCTTGSITIPSP